jgi:hypothetical protein
MRATCPALLSYLIWRRVTYKSGNYSICIFSKQMWTNLIMKLTSHYGPYQFNLMEEQLQCMSGQWALFGLTAFKILCSRRVRHETTFCWLAFVSLTTLCVHRNRGSSVDIVTRLQAERPGFNYQKRQGRDFFLFTTASRPVLESTQPPIQWVPGALLLGVKWPGCEADHLPSSSAEIKEWVKLYLHSPNTLPWHGAQLKHRDNFTFYRVQTGSGAHRASYPKWVGGFFSGGKAAGAWGCPLTSI